MIELSSAFYEAILLNNHISDPNMWLNYSKFKNRLYRNINSPLETAGTNHSGTLSEHPRASLRTSDSNSKSTSDTGKKPRPEIIHRSSSVNTLLYFDNAPESLEVEDGSLKKFQMPDKNAHSNNITEFITSSVGLMSKLDHPTVQVLQSQQFMKEFAGARLVVPSKSAFFRVIAFYYIETLLLGQLGKRRNNLRSLFHLAYHGKLALKGPNSVNPSETLRNTFCGYLKELTRQAISNETQAVATFYTMINHDPAFDQSMVSLTKEIIMTCISNPEFVREHLGTCTESEIKKLAEDIKNSAEITDRLMGLVSSIFQIELSIYTVVDREMREKQFGFTPDGTDQALSLKIISQNYKGYLNYFALYTQQSRESPSAKRLPEDRPVKPQIIEPIKVDQREVITSHDEYFALGKPENIIDKNRSNPSTPTGSAMKRSNEDSPGLLPSLDKPAIRSKSQQTSLFAENQKRSSETAAKQPSGGMTREAEFISPKGKQPAPTRSIESRKGDFKKLGSADIGYYRPYGEDPNYGNKSGSTASNFSEPNRPKSIASNLSQEQQLSEPYLRPSIPDSMLSGRKRSSSDAANGQHSSANDESNFFQQNKVNLVLPQCLMSL